MSRIHNPDSPLGWFNCARTSAKNRVSAVKQIHIHSQFLTVRTIHLCNLRRDAADAYDCFGCGRLKSGRGNKHTPKKRFGHGEHAFLPIRLAFLFGEKGTASHWAKHKPSTAPRTLGFRALCDRNTRPNRLISVWSAMASGFLVCVRTFRTAIFIFILFVFIYLAVRLIHSSIWLILKIIWLLRNWAWSSNFGVRRNWKRYYITSFFCVLEYRILLRSRLFSVRKLLV